MLIKLTPPPTKNWRNMFIPRGRLQPDSLGTGCHQVKPRAEAPHPFRPVRSNIPARQTCQSHPPECHVRFGSKADIETPASEYPLYPQKRTLISTAVMSALCHKRTYALQQ